MKLKRVFVSALLVAATAVTTVLLCRCNAGHTGPRGVLPSSAVSSGQSDSEEALLSGYQSQISSMSGANQILKQDITALSQLVSVTDVDSSIKINLKYATADNFTGKPIYPSAVCLLRKETADKIKKAEAKLLLQGYHLEIWDAYRPLSAQRILWAAKSDPKYIADPAYGSVHNRGAAVDVTLVDNSGNELEMPSGFDNFTVSAHISNPGMSGNAKKNLAVLSAAMTSSGFVPLEEEWWHFEDSDAGKYPILDVHLEDFIPESSAAAGSAASQSSSSH